MKYDPSVGNAPRLENHAKSFYVQQYGSKIIA